MGLHITCKVVDIGIMAMIKAPVPQFKVYELFRFYSKPFPFLAPTKNKTGFSVKPFVVEARHPSRTESAKIRNRRMLKKFNGTPTKPRLSVFCSEKQLYAMLVDDQNKRCLFYGNTLQKSILGDPPCTKIEAAERVGEELIRTCIDLNINEISSYDLNGSSHGERVQAFEIPVHKHGFLPR